MHRRPVFGDEDEFLEHVSLLLRQLSLAVDAERDRQQLLRIALGVQAPAPPAPRAPTIAPAREPQVGDRVAFRIVTIGPARGTIISRTAHRFRIERDVTRQVYSRAASTITVLDVGNSAAGPTARPVARR